MRSIVMVFLLAGMANAAELSAPRIQELRHLVQQDCGACHGLTRKGGLGPDIRAETLAGHEAQGLAEIIKYGISDTAMPPWGPLLDDAEINWIADYLLQETTE